MAMARTQRSRLTYARSAGTEKGSGKTRRNAARHNVTTPPSTQASSRISDTCRSEATFVMREEGVALPPREEEEEERGVTTTSS